MIKKICIWVFILCLHNITNAQTGWYFVTTPIVHLDLYKIQFTSENTGYAIGRLWGYSAGYLLKTTNGGMNWQSFYIDSLTCCSLFFIDNNTGYIVGDNSSSPGIIKKTTNGGLNWKKQVEGLTNCFFTIYFVDYNTGYAGGKYNVVAKTTNGGENWISKPGALGQEFNDIYFLNAETGFVAGNSNTINKTTDGGDNWIQYNFGYSIDFRNISFVNNDTGYVCSRHGGYGYVFKTTNAGENWICTDSIQNNLFSIFFVNPNIGYTCGSKYVYKTINGGYNWISQTPETTVYYNSWNSIFFLNENTGFITGGNGIIMKTTNGGNVFVQNISTEIPSVYSLEQNHPNPFNSITNVKFSVPLLRGVEGRNVTIKVFDLLGREITTLVNEKLNPGIYEVRLDAENLPSGIYFYRMETERFSSTKKLIIIQ